MRAIKFFLLALILSACTDNPRYQEVRNWHASEKLRVLTTTEMIRDLVENIGGDDVAVIALISGSLDPHSYQLVKGDDELFDRAHLLFANGLGLEHSPSLAARIVGHSASYKLGDLIAQDSDVQILLETGVPDPHIWMDIGIWKKAIDPIREALTAALPAAAERFSMRAERYRKELDALDQRVLAELHSIPPERRYLVTSHDAFNYFARAYLATEGERNSEKWRERFDAPEGLAPDSQLSTGDIQTIIDYLKRHSIRTIFPETNVSRASIQKIVAAGTSHGMEIHISPTALYGDAMGEKGSDGDSYPKMIWHNATTISKHLKQE